MVSVTSDLQVAARPKVTGPLRPLEIAAVAVFSGLAVAAVVVASVIPLANAAGLLAPVPLGLVAARTRPRALIAAGVTTTAVCFAVAGFGPALSVIAAAVMGGLVGEIKRRRHGGFTMFASSLLVAPLLAGVSVLVLWVLVPLRVLALAVLQNLLNGIAKIFRAVSLGGVGVWIEALGQSIVDYWWIWVLASGTVGGLISLWVAWWLVGSVLDRLADISLTDTLESYRPLDSGDDAVAPLPLRMAGVGYRYPGTERDVLTGIDMTLIQGEFVAIVGANGSGKSTLSKLLAGTEPTIGVIDRPGDPGLGRAGGTALVLQRPESQMLGSRVADDLVWGLPPGTEVDVEGLLAEVGLTGLATRETSDLSGGQQQRLALAAALARDPQIVIADEVTSMVDPRGREELIEILANLPARRGITVVLITHRDAEARAADRVIHLEHGRIVEHHPEWMRPEAGTGLAGRHGALGEPLLEVRDVSHTYLAGSPWEVHALHGIDLTVGRGDGLLIVGGNGSGKTTLAWLLAGLTKPSRGEVLLGGEPVSEHVGSVGLGFQHARLQLQKTTVADEIMAVGGETVGTSEVGRVLDLVALPRELAAKRVDSLSGGQMRRVVLASLIAADPEVLVLDEPLAGLDPGAREEVLDVLARLRAEGHTIVIISHDLEALGRVCNRRVQLVAGVLEGQS